MTSITRTCTHPPSFRRSARLVGAAALTCLLAACGGGGGTDSPNSPVSTNDGAPTQTTSQVTSLYFTDDYSAQVDAVWITVTRITAVGPSGETDLLSFNPGRLLNLPTLRRQGELVSTLNLPAGSKALRVYVSPTAQVQQLDGSMLTLSLASPGGYISFALESWAVDSGVLALDFDLPRFTQHGGSLVPATRLADNGDFALWNLRSAEVEGSVVAITDTSLVVNSEHFGQITLQTNSSTRYISAAGAAWRPTVGQRVKLGASVAGQGTAGLGFTALTVRLDSRDSDHVGGAGMTEVEGRISAVNGSLVSMTTRRSESQQATGAISFDVGSAYFVRGSAAALAPGMTITAYLSAVGTGWQASVVELEGAAAITGTANGSDGGTYAEFKGILVSGDGSSANPWRVRSTYAERLPGMALGDLVELKLDAAQFERGSASCLAVGAAVEVKGYIDTNGLLQPQRVSLEGACADAYPLAGVLPGDSNSSASDSSGFAEAKGTVTAVRPGEFDLSVHRLEGVAAPLAVVTVRHGSNTIFKQLTAATLAVGGFVEAKGSLSGAVLVAVKVERE